MLFAACQCCVRVHDVAGHTIKGVSVLYESLIALGVWGDIGLCQLGRSLLSHMCLLEGLGEASHRLVLPLALAFVVLLHAVS